MKKYPVYLGACSEFHPETILTTIRLALKRVPLLKPLTLSSQPAVLRMSINVIPHLDHNWRIPIKDPDKCYNPLLMA